MYIQVYTSIDKCTLRYILRYTFMYAHKKVTTTFHFESGLIRLATLASFPSTLEPFIAYSIHPLGGSILHRQTTQAGLATPKLPQPGVNLVGIAAPGACIPIAGGVHTNSLPRDQPRQEAGLQGAGQSHGPVGQRRDVLHESLQYGPNFLLYLNIPLYTTLYQDILGRYKYIPLIPCYTLIYLI